MRWGPGAFGEASAARGHGALGDGPRLERTDGQRLDRGLFLALVERYPEIVTAFRSAEHARRINDFLRLHSAFARAPRP